MEISGRGERLLERVTAEKYGGLDGGWRIKSVTFRRCVLWGNILKGYEVKFGQSPTSDPKVGRRRSSSSSSRGLV